MCRQIWVRLPFCLCFNADSTSNCRFKAGLGAAELFLFLKGAVNQKRLKNTAQEDATMAWHHLHKYAFLAHLHLKLEQTNLQY